MVIFEGKRLNPKWTKSEVPDTLHGMSEKGDMHYWMTNLFIPNIPPACPVCCYLTDIPLIMSWTQFVLLIGSSIVTPLLIADNHSHVVPPVDSASDLTSPSLPLVQVM